MSLNLIRQTLALKEELSKRLQDDPLALFEPNPGGQTRFIASVCGTDYFENWMIAANRSGKSDAGAYCGAQFARYGPPEGPKPSRAKGSSITVKDRATSGWVSGIDFPTLRDTIQPKYFDNGYVPASQTHAPFIPAYEIARWDKEGNIITLKNGSIVGFKSAASGRDAYQGAEKDWIHFDEEHPMSIYNEARIRVGGRRLRVFNTCTLLPPEGMVGGITWVFPEIIEKWQAGDLPGTNLFSASIYDNPHLPPEEISRMESIYPLDTVEGRIRLKGEWLPGLAGARAYSNFNSQIHIRPQPPINTHLPLCWICDFNIEPMIHLVGQRDEGIFRFKKELVIESGTTFEVCELFTQAFPEHSAEIWIYGDATARRKHHHLHKSDYQIITNHLGPRPYRLKIGHENPSQVDRINAFNRALRSEKGESLIEIDPSCKELIADLNQVLRAPDGTVKKTHKQNDPYARRTHASDAAGYWIHFEEPVRSAHTGYRGAAPKRIASPNYSFNQGQAPRRKKRMYFANN